MRLLQRQSVRCIGAKHGARPRTVALTLSRPLDTAVCTYALQATARVGLPCLPARLPACLYST